MLVFNTKINSLFISEYSVSLDFPVSSLHSNWIGDLRCKHPVDRMVYSLFTKTLKHFILTWKLMV